MADEIELVYYRTAKRPVIELWLLDDDGNLVDFTGATFEFKLGEPGEVADFTKTTGITGAAGSGTEPDGVPNVVITFDSEIDNVPARFYKWQLRDDQDRIYQGPFVLKDVIL